MPYNILKNNDINYNHYNSVIRKLRDNINRKGIAYPIRKIFMRKLYKVLPIDKANRIKHLLNNSPIIVFRGGANLGNFCEGKYYFL